MRLQLKGRVIKPGMSAAPLSLLIESDCAGESQEKTVISDE